jgi:hypothetical protein
MRGDVAHDWATASRFSQKKRDSDRTRGHVTVEVADQPRRRLRMPCCFVPAKTTDGGRVWWSQTCSAGPASLAVCLRSYPAGRLDVPATRHAWIAILVGRPVRLWCRGDGLSHRGIAVPGDVHIVPAGMPTSWEAQGDVTSLLLAVSTALLDRVAGEAKIQGEIATRFLMRDRQIDTSDGL